MISLLPAGLCRAACHWSKPDLFFASSGASHSDISGSVDPVFVSVEFHSHVYIICDHFSPKFIFSCCLVGWLVLPAQLGSRLSLLGFSLLPLSLPT